MSYWNAKKERAGNIKWGKIYNLGTDQHLLRGFAKKKNSKNPRLLWKWVGGSRSLGHFFVWKNRPKIALNQYWYFGDYTIRTVCVFCLYTLLKVVGYYDLSILSMSVMGFQKKSLYAVLVCGVSSIQFYSRFLEFFQLCKAPKGSVRFRQTR